MAFGMAWGSGGSKRAGPGGALVGVALLLGALWLGFWNEGRSVRREAALSELQVALANGQSAAYVEGALAAEGVVEDPDFGIRAEAIGLRRTVEMLQWEEKRSSRRGRDANGQETTVEEVRYEQVWSEDLIDSDRFQQRAGHANPQAMPFRSARWQSEGVRLDGRRLSPDLVEPLLDWQPLPVNAGMLPPNLAASFGTDGAGLSTAQPGQARVGDLRVRFSSAPLGGAGAIGVPDGDTLRPFVARNGVTLALSERGQPGAPALLAADAERNRVLRWVLRIASFVGSWVGIGLMLSPLTGLLARIPLLGRALNAGIGLVSGVLAGLLALLSIGAGWLWYRPWLLVLIVLAVVALGVWLARRRGPAPAAPPSSAPATLPPPPPPPTAA